MCAVGPIVVAQGLWSARGRSGSSGDGSIHAPPSRSMRELGLTTSSAKPLLTVAYETGVPGYRTFSCACTSLGVIGVAEPMRISRMAVRAQQC